VDLPWKASEQAEIDLAQARRILDEDHFGLDKIKEAHPRVPCRAQAQPAGQVADPVLRRPAGVGKTSLGQSIAKALGRKFTRVALGGVHDESEIRGHRRTYVGALPGTIIQAIKKAAAARR